MPRLSSSALRSLSRRTDAYHQQLYAPAGGGLLDYLISERGLTHDTIARFKLGAVIEPDVADEMARGMLSIPYLRPVGPVGLRFRRPPGQEQGPKYWQPPGSATGMFNTEPIIRGGEWCVVCEGEFDAIMATQCGLPAVGIPGVSNWKDHYVPMFAGFERVMILADNDDKGQGKEFAEMVAKKVPNPIVRLMPYGHDVNSFVKEQGADALLTFLKIK